MGKLITLQLLKALFNQNNPGGYDLVNRYGDEDTDGNLNDFRNISHQDYKDYGGLGLFHRTGYWEKDIVDYNTDNLKFSSSLHYKINSKTELIYKLNYGTGTTVYQGDNRFSLKDIQFFQNILELKQDGKFFIKAYRSEEEVVKVMILFFYSIETPRIQFNRQ